MDNIYNQTEFDKIWERVTSVNGLTAAETQNIAAAADPIEQLRPFIDREASDARFYLELARTCRNGAARCQLSDIAREEGDHLRKLQIEYFLLTGDTYVPKVSIAAIPSFLAALRKAYLSEERRAMDYDAAAQTAQNSRLAALYTELAAEEQRHQARIRDQITRILG